jgi:RNA polymerase sigma factor (sigma-70 family)
MIRQNIMKKYQNPAFFLYDSGKKRPNVAMMPSKQAEYIPSSITFNDLLVAVGETRDRDAFIRLFSHFAPRVKSFLMRGGMSPDQADELAQETMLSVWEKAPQYDPARAAASTWIFTIARNRRVDMLRKTARPEFYLDDPAFVADSAPLPDEEAGHAENEKKVAAALAALPDEQASMIRKAFFEDKTHAAIAGETGLPLGTVKSRIRLALDRLRYNLGEEARP